MPEAETKALAERLHHADQVLNALGGDHYAQVPPGKEAASALTAAQEEIERLTGQRDTWKDQAESLYARTTKAETKIATLRARNAELVEGLNDAVRTMRNSRGAIETNQVDDKDVRRQLTLGIDRAYLAALRPSEEAVEAAPGERREIEYHLDRLNAWLVELWEANSLTLHMCDGTVRTGRSGLLRNVRDDVMALRAALASPLGGVGEAPDPKERVSRDRDIILEAINTYDEWMLDDDYDAVTILHNIMDRMRDRSALTGGGT